MNVPMWQWGIMGILLLMGALLTFGAMPPNRWIGLRTARTLATCRDWSQAHRALGLITLCLVAIGVLLKIWPVHPLFQAIAGLSALIGATGLHAIVHRQYTGPVP